MTNQTKHTDGYGFSCKKKVTGYAIIKTGDEVATVHYTTSSPNPQKLAEDIVKACNNYPQLVEALRESLRYISSPINKRGVPFALSIETKLTNLLSQLDKEE